MKTAHTLDRRQQAAEQALQKKRVHACLAQCRAAGPHRKANKALRRLAKSRPAPQE